MQNDSAMILGDLDKRIRQKNFAAAITCEATPEMLSDACFSTASDGPAEATSSRMRRRTTVPDGESRSTEVRSRPPRTGWAGGGSVAGGRGAIPPVAPGRDHDHPDRSDRQADGALVDRGSPAARWCTGSSNAGRSRVDGPRRPGCPLRPGPAWWTPRPWRRVRPPPRVSRPQKDL